MADDPEIRAEAEVRLWGETVGALVELTNDRILFEYAEEFRQRGIDISPFHLPVDRQGPQSFEELRRKPAFKGLPGVFADALPDAFGRRVIRAYYEARGETEHALSPVQRLLYVGERALGALSFHPAEEIPTRDAEVEPLDLQELAHDASRIIQGEPDVTIPEIYRIGSSAGGRRPKAIVHYNPDTHTLRSGSLPPKSDEIPCILKFDGVGEDAGADELGTPKHYNRVEAAYGEMVREAGIDMPEIKTLEPGGYCHLLIPRFDIKHGERLHQHTFGGIKHVDYNEPGASSYEEYFRTIQALGMTYDSLGEAYRRMVFNVVAVNQDDHVKNVSFHMNQSGDWSLTPAYDMTFSRGESFTSTHQMRIRDKTSNIKKEDLLHIAEYFGIKQPDKIMSRIQNTVQDWPEYARNYNVPDKAIKKIKSEHTERQKTLAG